MGDISDYYRSNEEDQQFSQPKESKAERVARTNAIAIQHVKDKYAAGTLLWTRSNRDKVNVTQMNVFHIQNSKAILEKKDAHPLIDTWIEIFETELQKRAKADKLKEQENES